MTFDDVLNFLKTNNQIEIADKFSEFVNSTKLAGITDYITQDPTIVRGLDYYTGVVFEVFDKHPDNRRALCGGGAYANLLQIFNEEPLAGVGFGLGDVTLRDFLETHKLLPNFDLPTNDIALTFSYDIALAKVLELGSKLRDLDFKVVTSLENLSFKKVFPFAEKRGASFVGIIGSNELAQNQIQIKNMKTKEQKAIMPFAKKAVHFAFENYTYQLMFSILLYGFFSVRILGKERYNWVEGIVLHLFVISHSELIKLFLFPLLIFVKNSIIGFYVQSMMSSLISMVYMVWAYKQFFEEKSIWSTIWSFYRDWETDRKSTRLNSSHLKLSRMPSSA